MGILHGIHRLHSLASFSHVLMRVLLQSWALGLFYLKVWHKLLMYTENSDWKQRLQRVPALRFSFVFAWWQ
jgi:hypothetical protein